MAVWHNGQVRDNKNFEIRPVCFKFLPMFMAGKELHPPYYQDVERI